ncbi:hypothetical protein HAX54_005358, partial [Datura stramonium]|nr:hypothetical protein [Datura stramonium]
ILTSRSVELARGEHCRTILGKPSPRPPSVLRCCRHPVSEGTPSGRWPRVGQLGPTRLNAGSLSLFLELMVKRGLGQPYPNLVENWSRSPEEPAAGRNQRIVQVRKAGLRGEAPHGPPEQCSSSEPVTVYLHGIRA